MKIIKISIFSIFLLIQLSVYLPLQATSDAPTIALHKEGVPPLVTLETAMILAARHSEELRAQIAHSQAATWDKRTAIRNFGPKIVSAAIWQANFNNPNPNLTPSENNTSFTGSVSATQPIFGLVALFHSYQQKEIALNISELLEKSTRIQAKLLGVQYFLNYQLALQKQAIACADLKTNQRNKQDADTLFKTGSIFKDEYLRILLQEKKSEQTAVSAENNLKNQEFILSQALGYNGKPINIKAENNSFWESLNQQIPSLEDVKQQALFRNPLLKASQKSSELSRMNMIIAEDNYIPTISALATYNRNFNANSALSNSSSSQPSDQISYGLQLNWTLWDWGVRSAQNSSLEQQYIELQHRSESQKETLLQNVISQYYAFITNLNNLKSAKETTAVAKEALELVKIRFLNGQISALELTTAQQNLVTAQADLATARFNLDLAWFTFESYLGLVPFE